MNLRFHYLTLDEVNLHFARGIIEQADIAGTITAGMCHPGRVNGHCDGVIVDADSIPDDLASEWLRALESGDVAQPALVHGYAIDDEQAKRLQQKRITVWRTLTPLDLIRLALTPDCGLRSREAAA